MTPHSPPGFIELFRVFARIGVLSFGGPAAQIALMHKELVEDRAWLSEEMFLRALSFCMLLPGPEAMQLATYAGWKLRGSWAGLLAGLLFVLPGAFIIAVLVGVYVAFGTVDGVQAGFLGIKAAVIAIVLQALMRLSQKTLKLKSDWALALLAFVALFAFQVPFPVVVLIAALWGGLSARSDKSAQVNPATSALGESFRAVAIWLPLWVLPLVFLSLAGQEFLATIGWFFARLAVVSFGGAYAVLAYMTQTVVQTHGWVSTAQMIDALGLAETTPGPLILVTQFVAMLAGYLNNGFGSAIAAGTVALWATFIPCFLWIFAFAPQLEAIMSRPLLAAALKAITAAVVGVIANLSVWFAMHVLFNESNILDIGVLRFPVPDLLTINPHALLLTSLAFLACFRFKLRLELVLLGSALCGWLIFSLGPEMTSI